MRKARTNIQLAQSELEDQQKRAAHREARAGDLQAQVRWLRGTESRLAALLTVWLYAEHSE